MTWLNNSFYTAVIVMFLCKSLGSEVILTMAPVRKDEASALAKSMGVKIAEAAVDGATYIRPLHQAGAPDVEPLPVRLIFKHDGSIRQELTVYIWAVDVFGEKIDWEKIITLELPQGIETIEKIIEFSGGTGYFTLHAEVLSGVSKNGFAKPRNLSASAATLNISSVPPFWPGVRPNSFFASNTSSPRTGNDLALLQRLGIKVMRTHWNYGVETCKRYLTTIKSKDTWVFPIVGYSYGDGREGKHGPPNDYAKWLATTKPYIETFSSELRTWEFWNEPWITGWAWWGTAEEYRLLQKQFCEMALKVDPNLRILACNSTMIFTDVVWGWPECWKGLIAGITDHPYVPESGMSYSRPNGLVSLLDMGFCARRDAKDKKLIYNYVTEGGGQWSETGATSLITAYKVLHSHLICAISGFFQNNMQWEIGYGPSWEPSNTCFTIFTYMLEDRPIVADIYPYNEHLWGAIFANPSHITNEVKALPRAGDIQQRWEVEVPAERAADKTKVAVLFSQTGESNQKIDQDGKLIIDNVKGLKAFNMSGGLIETKNGKLILDFGPMPIYITSDELSVIELRERIRGAIIENITPVNMYALSLLKPATEAQTLVVRVQNQMPLPIVGTVSVKTPSVTTPMVADFSADEGRVVEVAVQWPGVPLHSQNLYPVEITVESRTNGEHDKDRQLKKVTRKHLINSAIIYRKTIVVDGDLSDWGGVTPVLLDNRQCLTDLESKIEQFVSSAGTGNVVAWVYLAYDDTNVYIAAKVKEPSYEAKAGQPGPLGYLQGLPGGIYTLDKQGDYFNFAFGFRPRVPGLGRQLDEPWAWKGAFYDTDYQYSAHGSLFGDKLVQHWDAETPFRRCGYQTDALPEHREVKTGKVKIVRAGQNTIYECAIPRSEIKLFDPSKMDRCRFSFIIGNQEGASRIDYDRKENMSKKMQYARGYGVFDYWNKYSSSFNPSWEPLQPCQTFFGIEGGVNVAVDATASAAGLENTAKIGLLPKATTEKIVGRRMH